MADFTYRGTLDGSEPQHKTFEVVDGTTSGLGIGTSITIGDVVEIANGYAALGADGGMAAGNILTGLATSTSTETTTADGVVDVVFSPAGLIVEGTATTPANLVTAVVYDKVSLDVAAGVQTVDENAAGAMLIYEIDSDSATTGLCRVVLPFTLAS